MADTRLRAVATAETCRGAFTLGQYATQKRKRCAQSLPIFMTAPSRAVRSCARFENSLIVASGLHARRPVAVVSRPVPAYP